MTTTSVLVVAAAPDERASTLDLRRLVGELADQPGTRVSVWFLRDGPSRSSWPDARVVDDLRTGPLVKGLRKVGLPRLADHAAGLLLRRWRSSVAPDLVLLDDGLGGRVLGRSPAPVIVRTNTTPAEPYLLMDEEVWEGPAVAELAPLEAATRTDLPVIIEPPSSPTLADLDEGEPLPAAQLRQIWRLPADRTIAGWWTDGGAPELRTAIDALAVAGLIVGEDCDLLWLVDRLEREIAASIGSVASDLGIEGRIHVRPSAAGAALGACDVVVRPAMADDHLAALRWALSGAIVVGSASGPGTRWMVPAAGPAALPDAKQMAEALTVPAEKRAAAARSDLDVGHMARSIMAKAATHGVSLQRMPAAGVQR